MEKNPHAGSDDSTDVEKGSESSKNKARPVRVPLAMPAESPERGIAAVFAEQRRLAEERRRVEEERASAESDEDDDDEGDNKKTQGKQKSKKAVESEPTQQDSIPVASESEAARAVVGLTLAEMAEPAAEVVEPEDEAQSLNVEPVREQAEAGDDEQGESSEATELPLTDSESSRATPEAVEDEEDEEEPQAQRPVHHTSTARANNRPQSTHTPVVPPPIVAPTPPPPPNAPNPNNPFYWQVPNFNTTPQSPNVVPVPLSPNVVVPPKAPEHSHEHRHPKLVLAFGAGLLVEHMLGKRADKKISADMRQRTDALRNIIEGQQVQQRNTEAALSATQQELQQQAMRPAAERLAAPVFVDQSVRASTESISRVTTRVETARGVRGPEATTPAPQSQEAAPLVPDTDKLAEANVKPQVVLERVAQAAEMDVPVEIAYERRQEVRDEPGGAGQSGGGGAATLPTILPTSQYQPQAATARQLAETQAYLQSQNGLDQTPQYKAAAATGFAAAVIIMVISLIAYATLR